MKNQATDHQVIEALSGRFPELLDHLPEVGWVVVKAAFEVHRQQRPEPLADFVLDLAKVYRLLKEIPDYRERLRFALVAKVCSLQQVRLCLVLARQYSGFPASLFGWHLDGQRPGRWQSWAYAKNFIGDPRAVVAASYPGLFVILRFVERVDAVAADLLAQEAPADGA